MFSLPLVLLPPASLVVDHRARRTAPSFSSPRRTLASLSPSRHPRSQRSPSSAQIFISSPPSSSHPRRAPLTSPCSQHPFIALIPCSSSALSRRSPSLLSPELAAPCSRRRSRPPPTSLRPPAALLEPPAVASTQIYVARSACSLELSPPYCSDAPPPPPLLLRSTHAGSQQPPDHELPPPTAAPTAPITSAPTRCLRHCPRRDPVVGLPLFIEPPTTRPRRTPPLAARRRFEFVAVLLRVRSGSRRHRRFVRRTPRQDPEP